MTSDRLTPLDASFVHIEDSSSHMHVAATLIFEGRKPSYEDFVSFVEARLSVVPRYRQRLATVPLGQGRPKWVDDEHFDIRFHIRHTALPQPGTDYELQVLAARVFSQPLSRRRPLWEMWRVEGLEGDRFAVISKTHHALVDGIAGLDILSVLFAADEEATAEEQWKPEPPPSGAGLLAGALLERATIPAEIVRSATALVRRPRRVLSQVLQTAAGMGAMAWAGINPAPPSPYNRPVGGDRRFTWVSTRLDDVKAIKNELGGTINDVVLAVVSLALRRDLRRRGCDLPELKAFVPISIRTEDQRGETGNQVAGMIVELPVGCKDPAECLKRISRLTAEMKESGQAVGAQALTGLTGFAPPNLLDQAGRVIARQRFINLVVTNVPGPQHPLSLDGAELKEVIPMVPLGMNLAFGVAIVSYNGRMTFGLMADFDALPDLELIAADFETALRELMEAAGVSGEAQRPSPRREPGQDRGRVRASRPAARSAPTRSGA
jgi:diacylglycerol O-acyltransferase / wax synthase